VEKLTREERKAATREALIRAGCDVVRARGFSVSVEEIANAAGFTKGAVYSNFEGRADLIREVAERVVLDKANDLDRTLPTLADALEKDAIRLAHEVDARPQQFVLTMDLFVTAMREPAIRSAMLDQAAPGTKGHPNEWPPGMEPPVDSAWFYLAVNALGAGLALQRLIYGAEDVPEELFGWAYRQLGRGDD
jgi:AcrR family transcriptional regulator